MNTNKPILISLLCFTSIAQGKDLMLTNKSKVNDFEKSGKQLYRKENGEYMVLYERSNNNELSQLASRELDADDSADWENDGKSVGGIEKCTLEKKSFCGNLEYSSEGIFKSVEGLPLIDEATPIKVELLRYNMHLGGDLRIPFSVLTADVTGATDINKENAIKLLDPEQGKLNIKWTLAGKYRIGSFCQFVDQPGGCTVGATVGLRYLGVDKMQTIENMEDVSSENAFGAYAQLSLAWLFPIYPGGTVFKDGNDVGNLGVKVSVIHYKQNIDDSSILFSDAIDADGNPIKFEDSYSGLSAEMNFHIDNQLSIIANYHKAFDNDQLGEQFTVSVSYAFNE